jgi:hypothetical protein
MSPFEAGIVIATLKVEAEVVNDSRYLKCNFYSFTFLGTLKITIFKYFGVILMNYCNLMC